ncbi:MAG: BTAD domain-containing putative transcriptional regulator, partial [Actinomycetota bacterium]|nr:BTAD domain-containing putative transcriptional regulator [Actinomycetota bacterium]
MGTEARAGVALSVLGDIAVLDDQARPRRLSPQRAHILAVLAAAPGQVVSRAALASDVWQEDDPRVRSRLKSQITQIRNALDGRLTIDYHLEGYRLSGELDRLDSTRFESLVTGARGLDAAAAAERYRAALALWTGPGSFGGVDSLLVDDARRRLDALRDTTVVALAECEVALGRPDRSTEPLSDLFEEDPTRRDVASALAGLLAIGGREADSLRTIERHRRSLAEIGLTPAPDVADLEGRILRHELPSARPPALVARTAGPGTSLRTGVLHRDELEARVLAALADGPVALCGEAGVGKTALIERVLDRSGRSRPVVRAAARADPDRPIEVVADLVEQLAVIDPDTHRLLTADPATAGAVARLLGDHRSPAPLLSRERLIDELARLVHVIVDGVGAVVVVDDAHWLDNSSAEIVARLIDKRVGGLVLAARRPLGDLPGDAWDAVPCVDVPPFTPAEVARLLEHSLPVRASGELADHLHGDTGGNGLFLRLRLELLAEGQLGGEVPTNVLHAVHERTAGFSRATREALQTAALLGQTFPLAPLEHVHPGVAELLGDAVDEQLVRLDTDAGSGAFVHGLVVDALATSLTPAQRTMRHDQLCAALSQLGASPIPLATQAVGATALDPLRACTSCLAAAEAQAQVFEWASVIGWADTGLATIEQYGVDDPSLEVSLRLLVGRAHRRLGSLDPAEQLDRAATLAHTAGLDELLVRCATELCLHGPTTMAGTVDPVARGHLERALAAPVGPHLRAELLSAAATLLTVSDESARARELYHGALEIAEAHGDEVLLRAVRMNAHLGLSHPDDLDARRRAAVGLATLDDPEARWEASFLGVGLALIDADRIAFDRTVADLRELTTVVKQRDRTRAQLQVECVCAFVDGDLDRAEALAGEALEAGLATYRESWAFSSYATLILPIREAQGRVGELHDAVAALREGTPGFVTWHVTTAAVAYALGDTATMARELDHLAHRSFAFVEDLTYTAVATIVARPILA